MSKENKLNVKAKLIIIAMFSLLFMVMVGTIGVVGSNEQNDTVVASPVSMSSDFPHGYIRKPLDTTINFGTVSFNNRIHTDGFSLSDLAIVNRVTVYGTPTGGHFLFRLTNWGYSLTDLWNTAGGVTGFGHVVLNTNTGTIFNRSFTGQDIEFQVRSLHSGTITVPLSIRFQGYTIIPNDPPVTGQNEFFVEFINLNGIRINYFVLGQGDVVTNQILSQEFAGDIAVYDMFLRWETRNGLRLVDGLTVTSNLTFFPIIVFVGQTTIDFQCEVFGRIGIVRTVHGRIPQNLIPTPRESYGRTFLYWMNYRGLGVTDVFPQSTTFHARYDVWSDNPYMPQAPQLPDIDTGRVQSSGLSQTTNILIAVGVIVAFVSIVASLIYLNWRKS